LVYVSTYGGFCPSSGGNRIWVVELDANDSVATRSSVLVNGGLYEPQGIDWSQGSLFIATSGRVESNQGNCILEIANVDDVALSQLGGGSNDAASIDVITCGFTMRQNQHH